MVKFLKPGISKQRITKLNARSILIGWILVGFILALVGCNLPPVSLNGSAGQPGFSSYQLTALPAIPPSSAILIPTTEIEPIPTINPTLQPPYLYTTQSGDSLVTLAARFGVKPEKISAAKPLPVEGLINPGLMLTIPNILGETSPAARILPDSEVVYSPTTLDFNIKSYVNDAGGYLSKYTDYVNNATHTGAEIVQIIAQENSINPRLLLGLLQYQSNWVLGQPGNMAQSEYPLGYLDVNFHGLYGQLNWAIRQLSVGYYGWRAGTLTKVTFPDQSTLRLSPEPSAGTVAAQYFFSKLFNRREWLSVLYSDGGFPALYEKMFDNPWVRTQPFEPFFPPNLTQPNLELPFNYDRVWSYTGGPHDAWGVNSPRAAIDLAPGSTEPGCKTTQEWVLASAPGLVIRSDSNVVMVDLDGDGYEQTGWVILYLHISSDNPVALGTRLNQDDIIGHPSCEGGIATGTHVHIARKYNGEWILADGPMPFNLSGWRVHAGSKEYEGTLTKDGKTITACTCGSNDTRIIRTKLPGP